MDVETAKKLIFEYGFIVLLNSPPGIEVGIDNTSWKTGSLFKGFKLVPPGAHILHFSLQDEQHMFKLKRFVYVAPRQVQVFAWSSDIGDFIEVGESEGLEEHVAYTKNMEYDHCLGAYPIEKEGLWKELTTHVSRKLIEKIQPKIEKKVEFDLGSRNKEMTAEELEIIEGEAEKEKDSRKKVIMDFQKRSTNKGALAETKERSANEIKESNEIEEEIKRNPKRQTLLDNFQELPGIFNWTDIPKVHSLGYLSQNPDEITEHNYDKTKLLHEAIESKYSGDWRDLLGELQMSFIAFIFGEDYEALEQWKRLCELLMRSEGMMSLYDAPATNQKERKNAEIMLQFIPCLYNQLKQLPHDFFYDIITRESFLNKLLKEFFEVAFALGKNSKIRGRAEKLSEFLSKKFGVKYSGGEWVGKTNEDLEKYKGLLELDGDDAPVIVEDFEFITI